LWNSPAIGSVLAFGVLVGCARSQPQTLRLEGDRLVDEWRTTVGSPRREIEKFFCERYGWQHMMPIPPEDAVALQIAARPLGNARSNEDGLWNTRNRIVVVLDQANTVAAALLGTRLDQREHTKPELGPSVVAWRSYLCSFTLLEDEQEHRPVWPEFYGLADHWASDALHSPCLPYRGYAGQTPGEETLIFRLLGSPTVRISM
jgi:hypothetical protein